MFYNTAISVGFGKFQTPAPRGGVPLKGDKANDPGASGKFQTPAPRGGVPLLDDRPPDRREEVRFKPLRLGAVFLCFTAIATKRRPATVSNPCASGRCSSVLRWLWEADDRVVFQTPAPRGGVPLHRDTTHRKVPVACFKPLRLGAVFL